MGSDNGVPPPRYQTIIWCNAGLLSVQPYDQISVTFEWKYATVLIQENALENVACQMATILSSASPARIQPLG